MNYLVTGATGFVGSKLVAQLSNRPGSTVSYLARQRSLHLPQTAVFLPWTTEQVPDLRAAPPPDVVFHLAGEPISQRWTPEVKRRISCSRMDGTRNLVNALSQLGKRDLTLISASAVGYYGNRGAEVLTEQSQPAANFLAQVCVDWEREASAARSFGARVVPVRISVVLGPDGGALSKMLPPFRFGLGAKFGSGKQWMSWIQIDDLVNLMLFAADNPKIKGALNGSSPQPVTNATFTSTLGRILHRPAFLAAPRLALRVVLGEMSDFLFASQRVIPEAAVDAGFRFTYPSLGDALKVCLTSRQ